MSCEEIMKNCKRWKELCTPFGEDTAEMVLSETGDWLHCDDVHKLLIQAQKEAEERVAREIFAELKDDLDFRNYPPKKIEIRKPTHGNCCTCQACGHPHDECVCRHNELVDIYEKYLPQEQKKVK